MQFNPNPQVLAAYCDKLIETNDLRIPYLPIHLERSVYCFAIRCVNNVIFDEVMKHQHRAVAGHIFQLTIMPTTEIPPIPKAIVQRSHLKAFVKVLMGSELIHLPWVSSIY